MINVLGLNFHLYGLILGVAMLAALEISKQVAKVKGVSEKEIEKLFILTVTMGVVGARLYHVADWWQRYYYFHPEKVFFLWEGGLGIWGAVIGGSLGLWLCKNFFRIKVKFLDLSDIAVSGLPVAQAIGRLGNMVNGELYGASGEPLFAYEGALNLILFAILWKNRKTKRRGALTGIYLIGYGVIRALLENLREEAVIWRIAGVPVAVIFSLIAIALGAFILLQKPGGRPRP